MDELESRESLQGVGRGSTLATILHMPLVSTLEIVIFASCLHARFSSHDILVPNNYALASLV